MKVIVSAIAAALFATGAYASPSHGYPTEPVPFTAVSIDDPFWSPRLAAVRDVTVPLAFAKCEETGRYDNFIKAATPSDSYEVGGFPFDDTDVYKTIEGASYMLSTFPDKRLESYIDSVLAIVAKAQEPDGYLNTSFTMNPAHPHPWMQPGRRWAKVEDLSHEFYNLGHMVDGAVAHYQATGKRNFLDIAIRYADCICREIGAAEGQLALVPGHQIAEMALARLYLATGQERYLEQAKFFLDRRGRTEHRNAYNQTHLPVTEQSEAVGHAVRAAYMYAGMADVAALTGDSAYIAAIDRIWNNIVERKLYITGAIGARHAGESFGDDYELPNAEAYGETCASIGNVYVNHRLFLLHGHARYYDVLERTLYNGLIAGMSVDGGAFFYPNPLASEGGYSRKPWFGCACCPSNLCRFLPSLPGYIYAVRGSELYVNLYIGNSATVSVGGRKVALRQSGDYTGSGRVTVTIDSNKAGQFALKLRIPGRQLNSPVPGDLYSYSDGYTPAFTVSVNGEAIPHDISDGYLSINRRWRKGDTVELNFDMTPRCIAADPKVEADRGRVAVERGPLVYCAEWPDNDFDIQRAVISSNSTFAAAASAKIGGYTELSTKARLLGRDSEGLPRFDDVNLTLIPYYAWAHRGEGMMSVWLPSSATATRAEGSSVRIESNEFENK
ncbi:MAG: glycoside hydrolase family 127 protein [Muribaculaceae bacterium]|nr:glycoside hydrolase family 127 protein [Muribaculaceae bacterium]